MHRVLAMLRGLLGGDRRVMPRDDPAAVRVQRDHQLLARKASKLNGHSADEILAEAYRNADKALR
jgi:hypothetical protein